MDSQIGGGRAIDHRQEFSALQRAMVWPALADYRSSSDIQPCEQTRSAMALIVVSSTLGLPGQPRKDGRATAERLDLTFLIYAQHDRVMGWGHIQPDDVSHLVDQQRIMA